MPARLKNGVMGAMGGKRAGAGRPHEWLKKKCREIIHKNKLLDFLGNVANGSDIDQVINPNGECLKIPASIKNRIMAATELFDRGYGKANQNIEINITFAMTIVTEVMRVLKVIPAVCPHCKTNMGIREGVGKMLIDLSKRMGQKAELS